MDHSFVAVSYHLSYTAKVFIMHGWRRSSSRGECTLSFFPSLYHHRVLVNILVSVTCYVILGRTIRPSVLSWFFVSLPRSFLFELWSPKDASVLSVPRRPHVPLRASSIHHSRGVARCFRKNRIDWRLLFDPAVFATGGWCACWKIKIR